jgi:iron complex outermembrane receptor protein
MPFPKHLHGARTAIAALFIICNFSDSVIRADDIPAGSAPSTDPGAPAGTSPAANSDLSMVEKLPPMTVTGTAPAPDQYQLPQTAISVTADQIADTVNAVDVEDAVKYLPSLFVRKRNYGDNQPVLETRTWGINSSARSLIYDDGVLLSALIANNNSIGAPRWGMVSPIEIESIDVLYGPFAAAYPGNSMGAVMEINTRMPDRLEASLSQTEAFQTFSIYSTKNNYVTDQTQLAVGNRDGKWSFWVTADYLYTHSQPLTFVTAATLPANTSGGIIAWNKLGQAADVLGASSIQVTDLTNAKVKVAYDFTPTLRATYAFGIWDNNSNAAPQTYLRDVNGLPTFGGVSGFAGSFYHWIEELDMQSFTLKSTGPGDWDWQVVGTLFDFDKDTENSAATVAAAGAALGATGKSAILGGTGWSTVDPKVAWHPFGRTGSQELSFGAHGDEYELVNPTYNTPIWQTGRNYSSLASEGNGNTETGALWAQDAWQITPDLKATIGGREEDWRAFDGININGGTTVIQPKESADNFSPKGTLAYNAGGGWTFTAEGGKAYRYPTAGELYQLVTTGSTFTSPNPNLLPEQVWSGELKAEHKISQGYVRVSLFDEVTTNALVSQYNSLVPGSSTLYSYVMNVGRIRNRGIEAYLEQDDVLASPLDLSESVTYVDSTILADNGQGQFSTAVGSHAPYVPNWRATFVATYRPRQDLALTLAGRYSGRQYSTVDNTDTNPNVYGGFDDFFVLDTHFNWKINRRWALSGGVDNLLNRKYFLFHPFPQRTFVGELKYAF